MYLYLPCDGSEHVQVAAIEASLSPLCNLGLAAALEHRIVHAPSVAPAAMRRRVGRRFIVSLADQPEAMLTPTDILLSLKPSLAFGSGLHPATQLSLQMIEQHVLPGMNVLDLGCGTGILSVAMAKLGAQVLALDNDRLAVQATQDAVQRNNVVHQVTVKSGSLGQGNHLGHWMGGVVDENMRPIDPAIKFDLIMANIQAHVHVALALDYWAALQPANAAGGWLITSGFTTDYAPGVAAAFVAVGFEASAESHDHDWVALAHRLKAQ